MGLFAKRRGDAPEEGPDPGRLRDEYRREQEELNDIRQKVEMVKDEYGSTVSSLMGVKRELAQRRMELDSATREIAKAAERARRTAGITGPRAVGEFNRTAEKLQEMRRELKKSEAAHAALKKQMDEDRSVMRNMRRQSEEYRSEIEEAESRLYDVKEELAKASSARGAGALSGAERESIEGAGRDHARVVEAASAVAGALKSRLAMAQKELETVQNLLEEERARHAEARRELEQLKSQSGLPD